VGHQVFAITLQNTDQFQNTPSLTHSMKQLQQRCHNKQKRDLPSSRQWNSFSKWTNSDWAITRTNDRSCCDVISSHGNRRM